MLLLLINMLLRLVMVVERDRGLIGIHNYEVSHKYEPFISMDIRKLEETISARLHICEILLWFYTFRTVLYEGH